MIFVIFKCLDFNLNLGMPENEYPHRDYEVALIFRCFKSLCKARRMPDRGRIEITYIPDKELINPLEVENYFKTLADKLTWMESVPNEMATRL